MSVLTQRSIFIEYGADGSFEVSAELGRHIFPDCVAAVERMHLRHTSVQGVGGFAGFESKHKMDTWVPLVIKNSEDHLLIHVGCHLDQGIGNPEMGHA